jgi:hypothetical protein
LRTRETVLAPTPAWAATSASVAVFLRSDPAGGRRETLDVSDTTIYVEPTSDWERNQAVREIRWER